MQIVSRFLRYVWGKWWAFSRALWRRQKWGKGCAVVLWFVAFSVVCYSVTAFGMALGVIPDTAATTTAEWNATQTQVAILALTPSATPTPTYTLTPSYTPTATFTPSKTPTPTDTLTPSMTYTPSQTFTPSKTFTPSNTPTATFTPTDTLTPTRTPTSTPTFTPSATATPTQQDLIEGDIERMSDVQQVRFIKVGIPEFEDVWYVSVDIDLQPGTDYDAFAETVWNIARARVSPIGVIDVLMWSPGGKTIDYLWSREIFDHEIHAPGEWRKTEIHVTPEPTPTPTRDPSAGRTRRYIMGASVNLRACAGTTGCAVVGQMKYGYSFTPWGVEEDAQGREWYMLRHEGELVYVAGWLTSDERPPTPAPYVAPPSGSGAGSGSGQSSGGASAPPVPGAAQSCLNGAFDFSVCANYQPAPANCDEVVARGIPARVAACCWPARDRDGDGVACYGD